MTRAAQQIDIAPVEDTPDYNPIGPEEAPDTNGVTQGQWMRAVLNVAPDWFIAGFYQIVKDIPAWWVQPRELVREYYDQLRTEPIGHAYTEPSRAEYIKARLADPGFVGQVRARLLGDYIQNGDSRQKLMHKVMRRTTDILRAHMNLGFQQIVNDLNQFHTDVHNALVRRDNNLANTVKVLNAHVADVAKQTTADMKKWVLTSVAAPIQKTANEDRANTLKMIGATQKIAHDDAKQQVAAAVALLLGTITPLATAVGNLQQESNDCVKPMCSAMGPKSDLGKMLTAANIAKWLAIFAALETISVKQLEEAAVLAGSAEGHVGEWITSYVLGSLS